MDPALLIRIAEAAERQADATEALNPQVEQAAAALRAEFEPQVEQLVNDATDLLVDAAAGIVPTYQGVPEGRLLMLDKFQAEPNVGFGYSAQYYVANQQQGVYCLPVYVGGRTITAIGLPMNYFSSGSAFRVGIYSEMRGRPRDLLWDSGKISKAPDGNYYDILIEIPIDPGLAIDGWAFVGVVTNSTSVEFRGGVQPTAQVPTSHLTPSWGGTFQVVPDYGHFLGHAWAWEEDGGYGWWSTDGSYDDITLTTPLTHQFNWPDFPEDFDQTPEQLEDPAEIYYISYRLQSIPAIYLATE